MSDEARLRDLERAMWMPATRSDRGWMDAHLAADFEEFGRSGRRYDRATALDEPIAPFHADVDDIRVQQLADGVALVTYRTTLHAEDGQDRSANRSSIWVRAADGWRLRFHQGTPCGPGAG